MQYNDELKAIKKDLDHIRKQGGKILFPDSVRSQLVRLWQAGCPPTEILKHCKIYRSQLVIWEKQLKLGRGVPSRLMQSSFLSFG